MIGGRERDRKEGKWRERKGRRERKGNVGSGRKRGRQGVEERGEEKGSAEEREEDEGKRCKGKGR